MGFRDLDDFRGAHCSGLSRYVFWCIIRCACLHAGLGGGGVALFPCFHYTLDPLLRVKIDVTLLCSVNVVVKLREVDLQDLTILVVGVRTRYRGWRMA